MLSLLHNRYTKNNKRQGKTKISNRHYQIQYIKDMQHKNVNMTWYYRNFPRHPVAAENFKFRGINTIILHFHYRVDPELGKGFCVIHRITCACPCCVDQLDKYWLPTIYPSSQPRYAHVDFSEYIKILEHYNDWIIVNFLEKKTPQVDFENIHALIISGMSTNKAETFQVNGYGAISANDE